MELKLKGRELYRVAYRPIHAHDCNGWDAAQDRARAAAAAARSEAI
jgi:hypothetical protein